MSQQVTVSVKKVIFGQNGGLYLTNGSTAGIYIGASKVQSLGIKSQLEANLLIGSVVTGDQAVDESTGELRTYTSKNDVVYAICTGSVVLEQKVVMSMAIVASAASSFLNMFQAPVAQTTTAPVAAKGKKATA
jgi:hypothetical protein